MKPLWAIFNQKGELAKPKVYPNAGSAGGGRTAILRAWDWKNQTLGGYGRPQLTLAAVEVIRTDELQALREKAAQYEDLCR